MRKRKPVKKASNIVYCVVGSLAIFSSACHRERKAVSAIPKEAEVPSSIARRYVKTNGITDPIVVSARLGKDGVWVVELATKANNDTVFVQVSQRGEVIWYGAPR